MMYEKILNTSPLQDGDCNYTFKRVEIRFDFEKNSNVFSHKNNKSLAETIAHKRYEKFKKHVEYEYVEYLNTPLGVFLLVLKNNNDNYYRNFLNRYGDLEYSKFWIEDDHFKKLKGVYAYYSGEKLKYIGRCLDTLNKRINQGYGKIHPKNCYIDGQATNCRINALVTQEFENVSLWFCNMDINENIKTIENQLIHKYSPQWNIQKT